MRGALAPYRPAIAKFVAHRRKGRSGRRDGVGRVPVVVVPVAGGLAANLADPLRLALVTVRVPADPAGALVIPIP